jgi:hypothetical protein
MTQKNKKAITLPIRKKMNRTDDDGSVAVVPQAFSN